MQCLGKLNGPECRIENIMDDFLFPIIFSSRAAISILLLFRVLSIFTFRFSIDLIQISIGGRVFYHGLQFPVTLEDSGGLYLKLSLSFRSRCTHSFGVYMILDLSIASGLFSIYFGILFLV